MIRWFHVEPTGSTIPYDRGNGVLISNAGEKIIGASGSGIPYVALDAFTVSIIVRIDGDPQVNPGRIYLSNGSNNTNQRGVLIEHQLNRRIQFAITSSNTQGSVIVSPTNSFNYGDVIHLCYTKAGGTNNQLDYKAYLNGSILGLPGVPNVAGDATATDKVVMGLYELLPTRRMNGIIYDVMHLNIELDAAEVLQLSNSILPSSVTPATTIARWKLDETSGTLASDDKGNRDLTLVNFGATTAPGGGAWRDENGNIIP